MSKRNNNSNNSSNKKKKIKSADDDVPVSPVIDKRRRWWIYLMEDESIFSGSMYYIPASEIISIDKGIWYHRLDVMLTKGCYDEAETELHEIDKYVTPEYTDGHDSYKSTFIQQFKSTFHNYRVSRSDSYTPFILQPSLFLYDRGGVFIINT